MTLMPAAANGFTSRVAIIIPFAAAVAAIYPSAVPIARPVALAFAISSAYTFVTAVSNGNTRSVNRGNTLFSNLICNLFCRFPAGSKATPKRSSATLIADKKRVSIAWASIHSMTRDSGAGRSGSEITLVSSMIIQNLPAWREFFRAPARSPRNLHLSG